MHEKYREVLSEHDSPVAHDPYIISMNRQLNFRHSDPSIAYIESEQLRHDEFHFDHADASHPGHDDYGAFDHHYLRYA